MPFTTLYQVVYIGQPSSLAKPEDIKFLDRLKQTKLAKYTHANLKGVNSSRDHVDQHV